MSVSPDGLGIERYGKEGPGRKAPWLSSASGSLSARRGHKDKRFAFNEG